MAKKKSRVVNPRFAKSKEYRSVIGVIDAGGKCPFCPENFKFHKKPILRRIAGWSFTENSWPYPKTRHHFIIISPVHKERLRDLTAKDMTAILSLSQWAEKKFGIRGGAITMRFGDTDMTGATVSHLHAHLIYPEAKRSGIAKTVNFPIG